MAVYVIFHKGVERRLMCRYPLTFVMAQNVINTNIDREFALQAMHRLHSCYLHVMEILRTNKARCFERSS